MVDKFIRLLAFINAGWLCAVGGAVVRQWQPSYFIWWMGLTITLIPGLFLVYFILTERKPNG